MPWTLFLRWIFAILPILLLTRDLQSASIISLAVVGSYWVTSVLLFIFYKLSSKDIPEGVLVVWIALITTAGYFLMSLSPLWGLSLYVLFMFQEPSDKSKALARYPSLQDAVLCGTGLLVVILYLGTVQEFMYKRLNVVLFHYPAGAFILLFLAALIWKNQPGKKAETK